MSATMTLPVIQKKHPVDDSGPHGLRVGDWVEVRSKEEILRTLDQNGRLEELPFMPEMFAYCGKRYRVYRRAHKTCDTVKEYKGRKMKDAVHLEDLRCDGQAHGGCQASCLIFWKTAWLRPVSSAEALAKPVAAAKPAVAALALGQCTETDVMDGTRNSLVEDGAPVYVCQATQLPAATEFLPWWEWRQYREDYTSGNIDLLRMTKTAFYMFYRHCMVNLGIGVGPVLMWIYDAVQKVRGGTPFPHRGGKLPLGSATPAGRLDLQPGEWARVKDLDAIRDTCDIEYKNRGMKFDAEMVPYCGGTYKVLGRVSRIVNEKTGKMQELKNPCIILDSVVCQARYSDCRPFCPRAIYPYWREIWLERVTPEEMQSQSK